MSPRAGTMLLAGSANLLLAGAWMFGALLGSNEHPKSEVIAIAPLMRRRQSPS